MYFLNKKIARLKEAIDYLQKKNMKTVVYTFKEEYLLKANQVLKTM
jgi:hypothetical protein